MSRRKSMALAEKQLAGEKAAIKRKGHFNATFLLWVFFCYGLFLLILCLALSEPVEIGGGQILTWENAEHVLTQETESLISDGYQVTMSTVWTFDGRSLKSIDLYVENTAENEDSVYFVLARLEEPAEILCVSPVLAPGNRLKEIKLEKSLPAGIYECVVSYYISGEEPPRTKISVTVDINVLPGAS